MFENIPRPDNSYQSRRPPTLTELAGRDPRFIKQAFYPLINANIEYNMRNAAKKRHEETMAGIPGIPSDSSWSQTVFVPPSEKIRFVLALADKNIFGNVAETLARSTDIPEATLDYRVIYRASQVLESNSKKTNLPTYCFRNLSAHLPKEELNRMKLADIPVLLTRDWKFVLYESINSTAPSLLDSTIHGDKYAIVLPPKTIQAAIVTESGNVYRASFEDVESEMRRGYRQVIPCEEKLLVVFKKIEGIIEKWDVVKKGTKFGVYVAVEPERKRNLRKIASKLRKLKSPDEVPCISQMTGEIRMVDYDEKHILLPPDTRYVYVFSKRFKKPTVHQFEGEGTKYLTVYKEEHAGRKIVKEYLKSELEDLKGRAKIVGLASLFIPLNPFLIVPIGAAIIAYPAIKILKTAAYLIVNRKILY